MNENCLRLSELLASVQDALAESFPWELWVRGEIREFSVKRAGHCYLTLAEIDTATGKPVAEARAIIWRNTYNGLAPFFESNAGRPLQDGLSVLVNVSVNFSELYGFSLIVNDIDPSFTIGELALQRQQTIAKLEQDGMMDMNAQVPMSALPRRLAVISAATAAGYGDFLKQLSGNQFGFSFHTELFPAPMQGADAPQGIIAAFDAVAERENDFDAVLLLRGGGSESDLACFDNYDLALNIAQFPLPVLTAIGHERDLHIADMVAYKYLKTPTALADYFVDIFAEEAARVQSLASRMKSAVQGKIAFQQGRVTNLRQRMRSAVKLKIMEQTSRVTQLQLRIAVLNPQSVLEKGYALVTRGGARLDSAHKVSKGDRLTLIMRDGKVESEVVNILK